jgi:hypothetical protein
MLERSVEDYERNQDSDEKENSVYHSPMEPPVFSAVIRLHDEPPAD